GPAVNYDSLRWTTSGTGTFGNPAIPNTTYTPGPEDIAAGTVTLTLTGWGNNGQPTTSSMVLSIVPAPSVAAGPDLHNCAGSAIDLGASAATNFASLEWTTTGNGTFDNNSILHPVYTPGSQDIQLGSVKLILMNTPLSSACASLSDTLLVSISPVPQVNLGADTAICANLQVLLDATIANGTSYLWSNGLTTAVITVDSTGTGIGSRYYSVTVTDQNTCSATDSIKISFKDCTGINEITNLGFIYYPNPSNGSVTLEFHSATSQNIRVKILSPTGGNIFNDSFSVMGSLVRKIDLNSLAQGTYLLELSNGKEKMVKKLVIQK
ncbi:MAG TPA: T9SS type A sorting domain-containing protein, partial [Bacteroidales bacterium]|nr:T9SS type A sorting domain-containing protein [Bacteroidales bacterium]